MKAPGDRSSSNRTDHQSRRNVLKRAGAALAIGSLGVSTSARADENEENVTAFEEYGWKKTVEHGHDKYYSYSYDDYWTVASTLKNHGGAPSCEKKWVFTFDIDSYGAVRRHHYSEPPEEGWKVDRIGYQWLELEDPGSSDTNEIYFTDDPNRLGGYPSEGTTAFEATETVFKQVAKQAVGELDKKIAGVLTAAEIYDKILSEWSESNEYDDKHEIAWTYADGWAGPSHSDVNHFSRWKYAMEPNDVATHYARSRTAPDGKGFENSIEWVIECHSPENYDIDWPACASSTSQTAGPAVEAGFDKRTREKYGLQPVPIRKLAAVGFDPDTLLGVPGKSGHAWWASGLDITAEPILSTSSSDNDSDR